MSDLSSDDLRRLASVCRRQAAITDDPRSRDMMIAIANDYEARAALLDREGSVH